MFFWFVLKMTNIIRLQNEYIQIDYSNTVVDFVQNVDKNNYE